MDLQNLFWNLWVASFQVRTTEIDGRNILFSDQAGDKLPTLGLLGVFQPLKNTPATCLDQELNPPKQKQDVPQSEAPFSQESRPNRKI